MKHLATAVILALVATVGMSAASARPNGPGSDVVSQAEKAMHGQAKKARLQRAQQRHRQQMRARMLERFDANGDGELDATEKQAASAARQARRADALARYDADHDGKLDKTERRGLVQERRGERFDRIAAKLDKNGDGALTPDELPQAGRGARRARRLERADRNRDGIITRDEFIQVRPARDQRQRDLRDHRAQEQ